MLRVLALYFKILLIYKLYEKIRAYRNTHTEQIKQEQSSSLSVSIKLFCQTLGRANPVVSYLTGPCGFYNIKHNMFSEHHKIIYIHKNRMHFFLFYHADVFIPWCWRVYPSNPMFNPGLDVLEKALTTVSGSVWSKILHFKWKRFCLVPFVANQTIY